MRSSDPDGSGSDLLDAASAIQAGIFGTLYTITKEKYLAGDSSRGFAG